MGAGAESRQHPRAMRLARATLLACALLSTNALHAGGEAELLAPTGHLRVGVYAGSPTSMVTDITSHETHGVTYELGKEFANRLNVPVDYITFPRIADVVSAIRDGKVDFTITNATAVRAKDVDFSQVLLAVELGYLVPANSPISRAEDLDRAGIRIGVTKGGTSERVLSEKFKNATIVSAESVTLAIEAIRKGELDVYATNKAILFQMAEQLPGIARAGRQLGTGAHGHRDPQGTRWRTRVPQCLCARRPVERTVGAGRSQSGTKGRGQTR